VPLSEHEQHLLEQMEQALYAEDPKFASQMQGSAARARLRRGLAIGAVGVIAGLGLVVLGVARESILWGAIGFALMVGGVAYAISPPKVPKTKLGAVTEDGTVRNHEPSGRLGKVRKGKKANATKQPFIRRLEERWDRRRDSGQ
jgi:cytosine/adenosine deaminase-related metal-dependent hydrolase